MAGRRSKKTSNDLFEVDKIMDEKVTNGVTLYKIHWKGYGHSDDTWEPESSLVKCDSIIQEYRERKASVSPQEKNVPSTQTLLESRSMSTPRRKTGKSLSTTSLNRTQVTQTASKSPRRYNLRHSTLSQRSEPIPPYLSTDGLPNSPIGFGYKRRDLHDEFQFKRVVKISEEKESIDAPSIPPFSSTEENQDQENGGQAESPAGTPSWMQLGYAEVFFCLSILFVILAIVWYLSADKFKIAP